MVQREKRPFNGVAKWRRHFASEERGNPNSHILSPRRKFLERGSRPQVVRDGVVRGWHVADEGVGVDGASSLCRRCQNLVEVVVGVGVGIKVGGIDEIHGVPSSAGTRSS